MLFPTTLVFLTILAVASSANKTSRSNAATKSRALLLPKEITCSVEEREKLDLAIAQMVGQRRFAETEREYRAICNEMLTYIRWSTDYIDKCLKNDFGRKAAQIGFRTVKHLMRQLCKSGRLPKRARELIRAAPCINAIRPDIERCMEQFTEALVGIAEKAPDKMKVPLVCCNGYKTKQCLTSEAEDSPKCTRKMIDTLEHFYGESMQGNADIFCLEYSENSDSCNKLIGKTPKRDKSRPLPKSPFLPSIQILSSIKDPEEL